MMMFAIFVAVALAFLAFRFIAGMIKVGVIAVVVLFGIFIAHQAGAF